MIDKEAQRRAAAELDATARANGVVKPVLPIPSVAFQYRQEQVAKQMQPIYDALNVKAPTPSAPKVKAPRKPKYKIEPFTNSIGQVIQPGASVIAIASARGNNVKIRKGTYLGLNRSAGGVTSVVVQCEITKHHYSLNGVKCSYNTPGAAWGPLTVSRTSALRSRRIFELK